jgi:hypothetical protein
MSIRLGALRVRIDTDDTATSAGCDHGSAGRTGSPRQTPDGAIAAPPGVPNRAAPAGNGEQSQRFSSRR